MLKPTADAVCYTVLLTGQRGHWLIVSPNYISQESTKVPIKEAKPAEDPIFHLLIDLPFKNRSVIHKGQSSATVVKETKSDECDGGCLAQTGLLASCPPVQRLKPLQTLLASVGQVVETVKA